MKMNDFADAGKTNPNKPNFIPRAWVFSGDTAGHPGTNKFLTAERYFGLKILYDFCILGIYFL